LCACEESQAVTIEFRKLGHEAYSCDIQECSGGHPEWHLQQDVTELLEQEWDLIIAFPPCTHLAVSGAAWFEKKRADGRQQEGIDFFMLFTDLKCPKVVIENPIGIMSKTWKEPTQIIQPYWFGDNARKSTCLWIKGLPPLEPTNIVDRGEQTIFASGKSMPKWYADAWKLSKEERAKVRSATFPGVAKAMATQWGDENWVSKQISLDELI
jgi:hypothetical protein